MESLGLIVLGCFAVFTIVQDVASHPRFRRSIGVMEKRDKQGAGKLDVEALLKTGMAALKDSGGIDGPLGKLSLPLGPNKSSVTLQSLFGKGGRFEDQRGDLENGKISKDQIAAAEAILQKAGGLDGLLKGVNGKPKSALIGLKAFEGY